MQGGITASERHVIFVLCAFSCSRSSFCASNVDSCKPCKYYNTLLSECRMMKPFYVFVFTSVGRGLSALTKMNVVYVHNPGMGGSAPLHRKLQNYRLFVRFTLALWKGVLHKNCSLKYEYLFEIISM